MRILFLCVANSARSQMAEGLARAAGVPGLEVFSAGSTPEKVRPEAIEVLEELGVDIRGQRSKGLSSVPLDSIDLVISLCAEEVCPLLSPRTQHMHWLLKDPARSSDVSEGVRLHRFRVARDEIAAKLHKLWPQFGLRARKGPAAP
jgi:arsenate reductase